MSGSDYNTSKCTNPYYDPWCTEYEHEGAYTELQVGPAPTQMHTFPIQANSTYEWSEWFKGYAADPTRIHGSNYTDAVESVNEWMNSSKGLDQNKFQEMDSFFETLATVAVKPENIINQGMAWGGLREQLTGKPLVPNGACPFTKPEYNEETRQWLDLFVNGTFSNTTLKLTPVNFEIDELWIEMLTNSMKKYKPTWLHHLFLGTYQLETGNVDDARLSFQASINIKPNVHAYRNLALFAPTANDAFDLFTSAWLSWKLLDPTIDPVVANLGKDLSSEIAVWLMLNQKYDELKIFLAGIQSYPLFLSKDRVLHATAAVHVHDGDWKSAETILISHCFPTYGSERSALIDLWWDCKLMEAVSKNGGLNLTKLETIQLRRKIGCDGDSTSSTVNSKCTRGPPNLGLQYGGF